MWFLNLHLPQKQTLPVNSSNSKIHCKWFTRSLKVYLKLFCESIRLYLENCDFKSTVKQTTVKYNCHLHEE